MNAKRAPNINAVLAENIRTLMNKKQLVQTTLAKAAGMGQTTVSLYLNPENRKPGKSGKPPSAKLSEVDALAKALDVEPWELLRVQLVAKSDAKKKGIRDNGS